MNKRSIKLSEISSIINANFEGDDIEINGLNLCNRRSNYNSIISYITTSALFDAVFQNKELRAIILTKDLYKEFLLKAGLKGTQISYFVVEDPEKEFYYLHDKLWTDTVFYDKYDFDPIIGQNCNIHPSVVVERGVIIKDNVYIGPNSVIRTGSIIEDNVQIGCCSVIGSEGFQAIRAYPKMIKHVGGTHIKKNVCIGDNTTVGNALFEGYTEVGEGSKIDNHVHFAHNCSCGANCIITACSLLMGSSTLKENVWLAPNSVILNNIVLDNNSFVGSLSFVNKNVEENSIVVGIPARVLKK